MLKTLYLAERERLRFLALDNGAPPADYLHPVFGEGPASPKLMLIGEAPGAEEAAAGKPFVGKAGKQLDELLKGAMLNREETFITNTVKYRPVKNSSKRLSNRTPSRSEILEGLNLLWREIEIVRPRIIATLGNVPLSALKHVFLLPKQTIGQLHGSVINLKNEGLECLLFPLYHPASVIYNASLKSVCLYDIQKLSELIARQN